MENSARQPPEATVYLGRQPIYGATRDILRRAGGRLIFDERPHYDSPIVTARFEGRDSSTLAGELRSRRVLAAARCGNLRVSPHFYNDETDLERLESALKELL